MAKFFFSFFFFHFFYFFRCWCFFYTKLFVFRLKKTLPPKNAKFVFFWLLRIAWIKIYFCHSGTKNEHNKKKQKLWNLEVKVSVLILLKTSVVTRPTLEQLFFTKNSFLVDIFSKIEKWRIKIYILIVLTFLEKSLIRSCQNFVEYCG